MTGGVETGEGCGLVGGKQAKRDCGQMFHSAMCRFTWKELTEELVQPWFQVIRNIGGLHAGKGSAQWQ